ncbi:MAG: group II intron reverse transcriptase/maturase [Deltaproteobacteria bacterium]|nr:MAG: group II intron reverse transcriptase/maturase [Deltaproteobacteria bacterium]
MKTKVVKTDAVSSGKLEVAWHQINWSEAHQHVRMMQLRIAKATREGKTRRVKSLQRLLTHSFHAKALAVKRVTENQGKATPGVDGQIWSTPDAKSQAVSSLIRKGYKPLPLRRVYIPKSNGKMRPLGIPTMKDRAMQALHKLALEPVAETLADGNSYGFRPKRACADAIEQTFIVLGTKRSAQWILEGDIKSCFDEISHDWLMNNIPMDKRILRKWLKAGYIDRKKLFPTVAGTPQGGIISPILSNMALDGLKKELEPFRGSKVNFVRYADDFIVTGNSKALLEQEVKPVIIRFLKERGLTLSEEKTKVTHIEEGFDFLGQNVRKYNGKLLIKPSKKNVKNFLEKVRKVLKKHKTAKQESVIGVLNPIIRGWANYHRHVVAKETFSWADYQIWQKLWQWCKRRHPNKGRRWIKDRYFHRIGPSNWVFAAKVKKDNGKTDYMEMYAAANTPIRRHVKIKLEACPYDMVWEPYFEERKTQKVKDDLALHGRVKKLWQAQKGKCPICQEDITKETGWNEHRTIPGLQGGKYILSNLQLLHPNCHRQLHCQDSKSVAAPDQP